MNRLTNRTIWMITIATMAMVCLLLDHILSTRNHAYSIKEGWRKTVELSVGAEIAVPRGKSNCINDGYVWRYVYPNIQKQSQLGLQQYLPRALSFNITSLFRVNPDTYQHRYQKEDTRTYTDYNRKTFEEVTGQTYSKGCLCQIADKFTQIFLSSIFTLIHDQLKNSIITVICQENLVYADVTVPDTVARELALQKGKANLASYKHRNAR